MKNPIAALCSLLCLLLPSAAAKDFTFAPSTGVTDYLRFLAGPKNVTVNPEGMLEFRALSGGSLAIFTPDGTDFETAADEVVMDFRTEGRTSFAVFLRAQGADGDAYMAFLGVSPDKSIMLYLCKTKFSNAQQPSKTALAYKHFQKYQAGATYTLRLHLENAGAGSTRFSAELTEEGSSEPCIALSADDNSAPITNPGLLGFRFFADKADGGGAFLIKSLSVSPN